MLFSWKMDQIYYFVLKYWWRRGGNISKFWVTSLFQHRCSASAGKQQFQCRKRIANFTSKINKIWQMTTVQIKKRNLIRWQPSTGKNDFNRFKKNNKCSNMNWLPFIFPKKADYKRSQDQTQFNWMIHFISKLRDEEVSACMCARVRKRRENEVTGAPNSQSQLRMNEPVF